MATSPSLIQFSSVAPNVGATTKTTASFTWQIGDVFVFAAISENGAGGVPLNPTVPTSTGSGLAWTTTQSQLSIAACAGRLCTAVASAASSGTISSTGTSATPHWGIFVWQWRASDGVGNSALLGGTTQNTKTQALTPTVESAIMWICADFNAGVAFTAGTPTPSNTRFNANDGTHYTYGVFDLLDQTSVGSTPYGFTGGGATGPFLIMVQEVKGQASVAPSVYYPDEYRRILN